MEDRVNSPQHYRTGGIETIDFIEAKGLGYNAGNVIKYLSRYQTKGNGLEDLRKAEWYLKRLIEEEGKREVASPSPVGGHPAECWQFPFPSPIEEQLEDVVRLNGAIPLPSPAPELWYGFPLGPILDGRNCPASCDCSDHQCPEKPQARPAITGDDTDDGVGRAFLGRPWINE